MVNTSTSRRSAVSVSTKPWLPIGSFIAVPLRVWASVDARQLDDAGSRPVPTRVHQLLGIPSLAGRSRVRSAVRIVGGECAGNGWEIADEPPARRVSGCRAQRHPTLR